MEGSEVTEAMGVSVEGGGSAGALGAFLALMSAVGEVTWDELRPLAKAYNTSYMYMLYLCYAMGLITELQQDILHVCTWSSWTQSLTQQLRVSLTI